MMHDYNIFVPFDSKKSMDTDLNENYDDVPIFDKEVEEYLNFNG